MKALVRVLLPWLFAASTATVHAEVVQWLYDVDVPVASQAERPRAARTGLAELLGRITGLAELPRNAQIQAALGEPEKYYGRFEFSRQRAAPQDDGETTEQLVLELHFEPATVLALLRRAALPVWSADRPTVLAWVAVDQGDSRYIVSASTSDDLAAAVQRRTRQRGLELSLPLMDHADHETTPETVWGRFWGPIEAASARYGTDVVMLGRVARRADGTWVSDWELRSPADEDTAVLARAQGRAESAAAAISDGVDMVADTLADRFAVGGRLDAIAVTIKGASTIAAYASVLDYLRSREYIERLVVKAVSRDALTLHLHSRSSYDQLRELLSMGSPLTAVPGAGQAATARSLDFVWRGDG